MPIRKDLRRFYRPSVWKPIRERILARDHNRCVRCRKKDRTAVLTYT